MDELKIGEVARLTGLPIKTIRYYEEVGLVAPPRAASGYRLYGEEVVARLLFVKRAKLLGITLEDIKGLVNLAGACRRGEIMLRIAEVLDAKLAETEHTIAELVAFRENLLSYRRRLCTANPKESCLSTDGSRFCACLQAVIPHGEVTDGMAHGQGE